ncbi:hypothetical protein TGARI_360400 [Toxoplasma gondii ARI]|uniref:Uncharacterized protein n=1 Tax=Toxoplasma gondii ARI TaxID=1074872 RepID=A0A139XSF2_TOXGO|nr:hypothetical protein TGARI_360400 [Toxoplasma gondii ARI]
MAGSKQRHTCRNSVYMTFGFLPRCALPMKPTSTVASEPERIVRLKVISLPERGEIICGVEMAKGRCAGSFVSHGSGQLEPGKQNAATAYTDRYCNGQYQHARKDNLCVSRRVVII